MRRCSFVFCRCGDTWEGECRNQAAYSFWHPYFFHEDPTKGGYPFYSTLDQACLNDAALCTHGPEVYTLK